MPVVVVANPKGGVGKSTLSTNIAGYFASQGHAVMLGDADRQQSSRLWLGLRPAHARGIAPWDIGPDQVARPPKGTSYVVLDTPAGLSGIWRSGRTFVAGWTPKLQQRRQRRIAARLQTPSQPRRWRD